ncbi:MAG: hypothetical protein ACR2RL_04605 [Gammaproteobacteria bacterium]
MMKLARTPEFERLRARLMLRAVLPTLAPLTTLDEQARRLAARHRYALRIATLSGCAVTLVCGPHGVLADPPDPGATLRLTFVSDRQANKVLGQAGLSVPIPGGHLTYLRYLGEFAQLAARLEQVLNEPASLKASEQALRATLMFTHLLPAAVTELANHEAISRQILEPYRDSSAEIVVPGGPHALIELGADGVCRVRPRAEAPGKRADLSMRFSDLGTAIEAVDNRLDRLAALGSSRLVVEGLVPLADDLGRVMERAGAYLR